MTRALDVLLAAATVVAAVAVAALVVELLT